MFKFNNGDKVKCQISGFTGVIVCRAQWFNGCVRYTIQPKGNKQSEYLEAKTFDEPELELVKEQQVPSVTAAKKPPARRGGPAGDRAPMARSR